MYQRTSGKVLFLFGLALLLAACSSSASPTATPPASTATSPPPTATPPAPTATPPPPTTTSPSPTATPPASTATSPPPTATAEPTSELPEAEGAALVEYVLNANPYQEWGTWPTDEWNDFTQFLKSGEPHGNIVRIFVNDVALEAAAAVGFDGILPAGSIVLKENYMGTDPEDPGELAALTIMYKVAGFNPEANDWFWVKAAGDGSAIDLEGAVGGCIGCHGQPDNADYLLRYAFGDEPAVPVVDVEDVDTETGAEIRPPEELYQALGCSGCHNINAPQTDDNKGAVAPNQGNLFETAGSRVPGQDAETYVYNSIVDPAAFVVEGYTPIMPAGFADSMSEAEIRALVAWLLDPNR